MLTWVPVYFVYMGLKALLVWISMVAVLALVVVFGGYVLFEFSFLVCEVLAVSALVVVFVFDVIDKVFFVWSLIITELTVVVVFGGHVFI